MKEKSFALKNLKILDENGNEKKYEIVGYVSIDDGDFLAYTDHLKAPNGELNIYVNSITQDEKGDTILDEASDVEVAKVLKKLKEMV